MAEFAQLEELNVYEAVNARFLMRAQRRAALWSVLEINDLAHPIAPYRDTRRVRAFPA